MRGGKLNHRLAPAPGSHSPRPMARLRTPSDPSPRLLGAQRGARERRMQRRGGARRRQMRRRSVRGRSSSSGSSGRRRERARRAVVLSVLRTSAPRCARIWRLQPTCSGLQPHVPGPAALRVAGGCNPMCPRCSRGARRAGSSPAWGSTQAPPGGRRRRGRRRQWLPPPPPPPPPRRPP